MMPGTRLLAVASRWFEPAVVASVFEPLVADWQREWQEAPDTLRTIVRVRGAIAFVVATTRLAPSVALAPLPAPLSRRVVIRVLLMGAVLAAIHTAFVYLNWRQAPPPLAAWPLRMPVLFTMSLPFVIIAAVDAIRCYEPWPDHLQRRAAIRLLAIVTLWMVVGGGWLVPAMNHRWRSAVDSANAGQPVAPLTGVAELSTYELLTLGDHVHPLRALVRPGERRQEIENRVALVILPFLLAWIRWRLLEGGTTGWFVAMPMSVIGACAVSGLLMLRMLDDLFPQLAQPSWRHIAILSTLTLYGALSSIDQHWNRRCPRESSPP